MNAIPEQMSLVFTAVVALAACLTTFGLHRIQRGQTTLLAALIIGAFLGPTVLGRVAPNLYGTLQIGGVAADQRARAEQSQERARNWLEAQRAPSGLEPERLPERVEESGDEVRAKGLVHWLMGGACLALMGVVCIRDRQTSLADLPLGASLAIGCGGVGFLIARLAIDSNDPVSSTILAGSCAAASCTRWGRFDAGRVRMNGAARVSTMMIVTIIIVVLVHQAQGWETGAYLLAVPLLASLSSTRNRDWLIAARKTMASYLPPVIVAISLLSIDLLGNLRVLWIAALAWLTMSDLKSVLGALILKSTGMSGTRSWVTSLQLLGTGLMPVALTGYAVWIIGLPQDIACALFIAAAVAQVEGVTRSSAGRILCSIRRIAPD